MLAATGRRQEAELELLGGSSRDLRAGNHRSRCVDPAVKLAEVRLSQGRLEEARALLEGRSDCRRPCCRPPSSTLRPESMRWRPPG